MRRLPRPADVVRHVKSLIRPPATAPGSTLPYVRRRPTVTPILPVQDMSGSIDFYRSLGFAVRPYDDGYAWVINCGWEFLHLRLIEALDADSNAASAYVHVDDADAWHASMDAAAGGNVVGAVSDTPWGMREFAITDPSGNLIRFGRNR